MLLCMLIHWLAALFFLIAARPGGWIDIHICQQRTDELAQHSFFVPVRHPDGVGLGAFECVPQGDSDAAFGIYILTYYYVLLMLMGDDVGPTNQYETLYMVFVILVGSCVNATIFANVASLTAQMTADAVAHQAKMDGIDRTMRQLHLDKATTKRIRGYFNYRWVRCHRARSGSPCSPSPTIGPDPRRALPQPAAPRRDPRFHRCATATTPARTS